MNIEDILYEPINFEYKFPWFYSKGSNVPSWLADINDASHIVFGVDVIVDKNTDPTLWQNFRIWPCRQMNRYDNVIIVTLSTAGLLNVKFDCIVELVPMGGGIPYGNSIRFD